MLIMKRRIGDKISVDPGVTVTVLETHEDQVVLRFKRENADDNESHSAGSDHTLEPTATGLN